MNEQIKLLAEQAHEFAVSIYEKRWKTEKAANVFFYKIKDAKFAELIIRECISQCEQVVADTDTGSKVAFITDAGRQFYVTDAGRQFYKGMWSGAKNCSERIQFRFGIEELPTLK